MTVLCANCHTANRDRAMFCIGCAGKLPAFAATGPSALQALDSQTPRAKTKGAPRAASPSTGHAGPMAHTPRGLVAAVLLLGATVLVLAAWISFGPGRAEAPGIASAAAPLTPLPATPVVATAPAVQVPVEAALAPGESTVAPTSVPVPVVASAPLPTAAMEPAVRASQAPARRTEPQQSPQRVASVTNVSGARGAADPRVGCEDLFFVLAARCEANHCDEAAYTRHPRCNVVREQRRRDEARRNLTQ